MARQHDVHLLEADRRGTAGTFEGQVRNGAAGRDQQGSWRSGVTAPTHSSQSSCVRLLLLLLQHGASSTYYAGWCTLTCGRYTGECSHKQRRCSDCRRPCEPTNHAPAMPTVYVVWLSAWQPLPNVWLVVSDRLHHDAYWVTRKALPPPGTPCLPPLLPSAGARGLLQLFGPPVKGVQWGVHQAWASTSADHHTVSRATSGAGVTQARHHSVPPAHQTT